MAVSNPSPERYPVISFLGIGADLVFWEKVDMKLQRVRDAKIGDRYWDTKTYPNHILVYKTPLDKDGQWYKFFYAANRENQDEYNFEMSQGEQVVRSYVIPRNKYFARSAAAAAAAIPLVEDEFTVPAVATPDVRFSQFGFADDTISRTETELDSVYIVIQRRFIVPVSIEYVYNEELDSTVKITKTLVPRGTPAGSSSPGDVTELREGNAFHDILIRQECDAEKDLPTIPAFSNYSFPPRLDYVDIKYVYAWAYSADAAPSYSEDYYFDFGITEARPGPFQARIKRKITTSPDLSGVTLANIPSPKREAVGVIYAWGIASNQGNQTTAVARQIEIPATVHGLINIGTDGTGSGGTGNNSPASNPIVDRLTKTSLPPTTGFPFGGWIAVNAEVRKLPLGYYEQRITEINASGVYV